MQLVKVSADLGRIPTNRIPLSKGADGKIYYKITYDIQVTYCSAYTTYGLCTMAPTMGSLLLSMCEFDRASSLYDFAHLWETSVQFSSVRLMVHHPLQLRIRRSP